MKESDFIVVLQTHQECLIDEKRFKAILNDLYPEEVRMNNILVNLFHLGLPRDIEEAEKLDNIILNRYSKKVVQTYGIEENLANDAIKLWLKCYGGSVLGKEVNVFVRKKVLAAAPGKDKEKTNSGQGQTVFVSSGQGNNSSNSKKASGNK